MNEEVNTTGPYGTFANVLPEPEKMASGATPCSRHFICPDGDMHPLLPVASIWVVAPTMFHRKWRARLEYMNGEEWSWDRDNQADANEVRDKLIRIFIENA